MWIAHSGRDLVSKIYGIHSALLVFAAMGYDHVVANMYFIPLGIKEGAGITVGQYIYKSLLPSLLGNVIGGGFFVALPFWYINLYRQRGRDEVPIYMSVSNAPSDGSGSLPVSQYEYPKRDQEQREITV